MLFFNVISGNITGKNREYYIKNSEGKIFNNLYSYFYLKDHSDEKVLEAFELTKGKIMIDSGAFTAKSKNIEIDVDKYIKFINKWDQYVYLFGQIDIIPPEEASLKLIDICCEETWKNYLYMYERINSPKKLLYTFHFGEQIRFLKQALSWKDKNGSQMEYIALGGLVGKSTKQREKFLSSCFKIIKDSHNPNVKVHGFGVSTLELWLKYPFASCDSSSASKSANCGTKCTEIGTYKVEDYEKLFSNKEQNEADVNERIDMKTKLQISNIEYYHNMANEISQYFE